MTRKIKVGVFSSYYPTYRDAVFAYLSKQDKFEFTFYSGAPPENSYIVDSEKRPYKYKKIICRSFNIPGTKNAISYRSGVIKSILKKEYDVFIVSNDILGIDIWLSCLIAKIYKVPICIWGQGMSRPPSNFRNSLRKLLTRLAKSAVYYSEGGKQYWVDRGISSRKLFVAYNALDTTIQLDARNTITEVELQEFLRIQGLTDKRVVVYLGRLIQIKKPTIFIDAVAKAYSQDHRVCGILIGDGPQRGELEQQARAHGILGKAIIFLGEAYDEFVLARYLMISSAVVLPAAAGLAIQHAAVYGSPLILGDILNEHLPEQEIVEEGKTGLWCPDGDVGAFAAAILRLSTDSDFRDYLSANVKREIDEKYNVARMAQGFIDAVQYCLE